MPEWEARPNGACACSALNLVCAEEDECRGGHAHGSDLLARRPCAALRSSSRSAWCCSSCSG